MPERDNGRRAPDTRWIALAVAGLYGFLGALWIGYSDQFVGALDLPAAQLTRVQQYKGWGYVVVTAVLLYFLLHFALHHLQRSHRALQRNRDRLLALNRLYRMVRAVKGALLQLGEREVLLQEVCRVAVVEGGYRLAWIALWEPDGRHLRAAAHAGAGTPGVPRLRFAPDEANRTSPVVTAALHGRVEVARDLGADPALDGHGGDAARLGYAAVAAVPIGDHDGTRGALAVYADTSDAFDAEETRLLAEIGDSIALGLHFLQRGHVLEELTHYDTLTGLANRGLAEQRLAEALTRAHQRGLTVGAIALDIDDFRQINNTGGRQAGDRALQAVAQILAGCVRPGDTIARVGNDEFAVVIADVADAASVSEPVNRIADSFPQRLDLDGTEVYLSVSMGIAVHPGDADDAEELLGRAELSLHSQSPGTSGRIIYYEAELDERARHERELEIALRTALDGNELHLEWQPIIDPEAETALGAEALLRWQSPRLGSVGPGEFVPIAERTGLIVAIGDWVLDAAAAQASAWAAQGLPLQINVNVALQQLQHRGFVEHVERVLESARAHGWTLALELTESEFMADIETTVETCRALRRLGCRLEVDDFGIGYSALNYLTRLPVDGLKIDRTFVARAAEDPGTRAIVEAVVTLSRRLGLGITAEGIETGQQLALVRGLGCHHVQGFLYGRPVNADAFASTWQRPRETATGS